LIWQKNLNSVFGKFESKLWISGVQAGFALQNANVSRILSNYGADLHLLSFFWL
jgi:hypothetical protein